MNSHEEKAEKERMARLVRLAKEKDANAFSLLYEMVYTDLYRMALYTLGNSQDAEDIVSETVLDAYVQLNSLRDETAFRRWIFHILGNKCKHKIKEYMRERGQRSQEPAEALQLQSEKASTEMENIIDRQDIAHAFASLEPDERLIVTMVVYGGYNSREIAELLHKNRNTIRSKYRRSLEKMQKLL